MTCQFMMQHPWMTFFIALAALEAASKAFVMVTAMIVGRR